METDAGQNIVPFVDVQPVESNLPLSGVQLYHRGTDFRKNEHSGGYLALMILHYDMEPHFS